MSHSAKIADGVVDLARQMGDGEVALAAAGGIDDPDDPIGTDAFVIKGAIEQVWSEAGVLVLMDLGSAVMNAEMAVDLLEDPVDPSRVLLCEAPLVEGAVAAAAASSLGSSLAQVADEARAGLMSKSEHLGSQPGPDAGGDIPGGREEASVTITVGNRLGLHLRPAGRLVETLGRFDVNATLVNVTTGAGPYPGRSLSRVSALGARQGHVVEVRASGPDAEAALKAVVDLARDDFGDRDDPTTEPATPTSESVPVEGVVVGVPASPGVAVGPARRLRRPALEIPATVPSDADIEWSRLRDAIEAARGGLERQRTASRERAGEAEAAIFDAHLLILDDEAITETALEQIERGLNSEQAWSAGVEEVAAQFRALEDPYQAERVADIEAVGRQVLAHLLGVDPSPTLEERGVLVADDLTPGETATLDRALVEAIVTTRGGATSHSAIIARALGVPSVVAVGRLDVSEGTVLLVDGTAGTVTVDPDETEIQEALRRASAEARRMEAAGEVAAEPATTTDGATIEVAANIGSVDDARQAVASGADGVGLLRTEFLYLDRHDPPDEDEQASIYRSIVEVLGSRPLLLRTLDVGGDKPVPFLDTRNEENPFLGVRGLRLGLARPDLLVTQLRAALRSAGSAPLRVMFPMVSTLTEWEAARALVARAMEEVGAPDRLELGVMVEVPSLPLLAERFAPVVDFFSVGTNDLTQYVLAAERGNPELGHLHDALHPAVLSLIRRTCEAAEDHGRWVGVCGELAADPVAIPLLIGLGVTELSMSPVAIPRAKQVVRLVDRAEAVALAHEALAMSTAGAVRLAARRHLASLEPRSLDAE